MERNTIQKEIIYKQVMSMDNHPTADDIYNAIKIDHPQISKGTIYRVLNQLASNNRIFRIRIPGSSDIYDYKNYQHFHLYCQHCQRLYDLDIDEAKIKIDVKSQEKGFHILGYSLIFEGICPNCKKEKEN